MKVGTQLQGSTDNLVQHRFEIQKYRISLFEQHLVRILLPENSFARDRYFCLWPHESVAP